MPNQNTYVDEDTAIEAMNALMGQDHLSFSEARAAYNRLRDAGLLIREPFRRDEATPANPPSVLPATINPPNDNLSS